MTQQSMVNYSRLLSRVKKREIKRVRASLGLYKGERMCVSSEVVCARLVHEGCIREVNG